jgi:1-acyl-sn-glycerol-3-phosphate acyltransferase
MRWRYLGGTEDPTPEQAGSVGMDRGRRIGISLSLLMYRLTVAGMNRVPATGPLVVVANHSNFWDGPVLFGALPRRVSFLIKAEAVTGPVGWLLRNVGQYAINRDVPDRKPLLEALAQLKAGGAIGVFPEGTRGDGNVQNISSGAGWLAARSGAAVLPVAVRGTARPDGARRRFRPPVRVLIGEPFVIPLGAGRTAVDAATDLIRDRLSSLVIQLDDAISSIHGKKEMQ